MTIVMNNIPGVVPAGLAPADSAFVAYLAGARYTSYPAPEHFTEAYDATHHRSALAGRALSGPLRPLAIYVHLPFCTSTCHYCSCHTVVTQDRRRANRYLQAIRKEARLVRRELSAITPISRLYIGGGTPTFLEDVQLQSLKDILESTFKFDERASRFIEVDPRTTPPERLETLRALGFDHLEVGAQDLNTDVLANVNRPQPPQAVIELVQASRGMGFKSVTVDLLCGLPQQSTASFALTLETVIRLEPDSINIYPYHHLPDRHRAHRLLDSAVLPPFRATHSMMRNALNTLVQAGWIHLGMHHFVRPDHPLATAQREGRLHRNFQGYTTVQESDLIALGMSAISRIGITYAQNVRTLSQYYEAIESGRLAIERGHGLSADDILRHAIIMSIMCRGYVSFPAVEEAHFVNFNRYFRHEIDDLLRLEHEGLIRFEPDGFAVTDAGYLCLSYVAQVFDRYERQRQAFTNRSRIL